MAFLGRMLLRVGYRSSIVFVMAMGCSDNAGTKASCASGSERCHCYGNDTCDDGLVCRSNVCVDEHRNVGGNAGESNEATTGGTASGDSGGNSSQLASGGVTSPASGSTTTSSASGGTFAPTGGASALPMGGNSSAGAAGAGNLGPNQISNGDFSLSSSYWHVTDVHGDTLAISSVVDGAFCITTNGEVSNIGYPAEIAKSVYLQPGGTYAFTFRVVSSVATKLYFKVGYVNEPYTEVFINSTDIGSTWTEYRYTFVANVSHSIAQTTPMGIAFTNYALQSGIQICIDDVVLALVFSP